MTSEKKIEVVFAEFDGKFKPDVDNIREYFPEADINLHIDHCTSLFEYSQYWGYYMNDFWKVAKLLESKADIDRKSVV